MGLFSWLRMKFTKTPRTPNDPRGSGGSIISYVDRDIANNETIFSAISILSNAIASAPVSAYCKYEKLEAEENDIAELLKFGPNNFQTTFEFIRLMETLRNRYGAAYAIKEYDRDALGKSYISALYVMDSEAVTPMLEAESKELYYRIESGEGAIYVHSEHIIAVSHINTDGYTRISPIDVLRGTINYSNSIKEFNLQQMQEGLNAKLAITLDAALKKEDFETYDFYFKQFRKNGILYLGRGQTAAALNTSSIIDPKLFEAEEITVQKVARVYNIPPSKLLTSKGTNTTIDSEDLIYLKDTILPIIRMYEQAFTNGLFSYYERMKGYRVKFSLNGFARASMEKRGEFYQKGLRNGWFTINEIRELEDMAPLEDDYANSSFISRDLIPVNLLDDFIKDQIASSSKTPNS